MGAHCTPGSAHGGASPCDQCGFSARVHAALPPPPPLAVQVAEVTAQNEYQLKLKDLALNEKVRELTDKAAGEAADAAQR